MPTLRPFASRSTLKILLACLGGSLAAPTWGCTGDDADDGGEATDLDEAEAEAEADADADADDGLPEDEIILDNPTWPRLECDPLVAARCALPFPSNVFSEPDASTPTGRRVALAQAGMPRRKSGFQGDPAPLNRRDGFSPSGAILAHLPGATAEGLAGPWEIEWSVLSDTKTVLLDTVTGELVPHFAELDLAHANDAQRSLMIRPVFSLEYGRRYIVAVRGLVDASGQPVAAPAGFAALRDRTESDEPSIQARRALYGDIFARLRAAGIDREDLQLAWDFTTASRPDTNGHLVSMRDQAFEALGADGPVVTVTAIQTDISPHIAIRIDGQVTVPQFLDQPGIGGKLVYEGGQPKSQGETTYPFLLLIPYSAERSPATPMLLGHGLFGTRAEALAGPFQSFANQANFALLSLDWLGMSAADPFYIASLLEDGRIHDFQAVPDRLSQALLNFELAARAAKTTLAALPETQGPTGPLLDTSTVYYYGGSQGGIMGSPFLAISREVERGVLAVPGQPYNLLLERSKNYNSFRDIIVSGYETYFDQQLILAFAQHLWDRAEPAGYSRHVELEPLPGTPPHQALMMVAIGDHQVTTLGAHVMARSMGAANIGPVNREVWGIPVETPPYQGSAMIEYDFGLPPEPTINVPMTQGSDPHGALAGVPIAFQTVQTFLRTGVVETFCTGPCDPT